MCISSFLRKEEILLGLDQNKEEREHLLYVIAVAAGKVIGQYRPEAAKLVKQLPVHHKHENSGKKLSPALAFIQKPYPYQETKNPDTIKLLIRIQRQHLENVDKFKNDRRISDCISKLEDPAVSNTERELAEVEVKKACMEYGELILHGDLLTVKMIQEARMLMAGTATAFERLVSWPVSVTITAYEDEKGMSGLLSSHARTSQF